MGKQDKIKQKRTWSVKQNHAHAYNLLHMSEFCFQNANPRNSRGIITSKARENSHAVTGKRTTETVIQKYIKILIACLTAMLPAMTDAQTRAPWVTNVSQPHQVTKGLKGRHLSIWPSHGRYYSKKKGIWEWQRPQIFCTTEDLLTQSIVTPYLIPMLENAGANVFMPRERDWQTEECIVDNDIASSGYMEYSGNKPWIVSPQAGYAIRTGNHKDNSRPFSQGSARMAQVTQTSAISKAYYRPNLRKSGRYAVYVSYQTVEGSVNDAEYVVMHQGQSTKFKVNQQMGSGTWVYLGTFDFDAHSTFSNYVMVTNSSSMEGFVTTDAVRFGGGMGNHERGGMTSGLPRAMECSRYWTQYAGAPRSVTCSKGGNDDYGDDINCRSLMSNWLSYGSYTNPAEKAADNAEIINQDTITIAEAAAKIYLDSIAATNPDSATLAMADSIAKAIADSVARIPIQQINVVSGKVLSGKVPIELQLGIHSDAGRSDDFNSIYGSLAICTSNFNDNKLASGKSRRASFDFACDILYNATRDIKKEFGTWVARDIWDRNYSETRLPAQPSAILEMLSHENFADMRMAHDPYFKFVLARSIYKTILKFIARHNGKKAIVQPLAPTNLSVRRLKANVLTLSWAPQTDPNEATATPKAYNLYTKIGDRGYDNGVSVGTTEYTIALKENTIYRFRVTATNEGGESFPTEELVAMYNPKAKATIMIVNAFHRLSSPAVIDNDSLCGFDLQEDIGLSYGKTLAWTGQQKVFDKQQAGKTPWLGYSDDSLLGRFTAGNDFNYAYTHAEAIRQAGEYNIVSISSGAFTKETPTEGISMIDIIFGNEKNDGHSLKPYKTFTPQMREAIEAYQSRGGNILVSGSYITSDMSEENEQQWMAERLQIMNDSIERNMNPFGCDSIADTVCMNGKPIAVYRHVNEEHYASVASDILRHAGGNNTPFMTYASGTTAAVTHSGKDANIVAMGFPFECIKNADDRAMVMKEILQFIHGKGN